MFGKAVTIIYLIIGGYFVYCGFTLKGKLYENPSVAENKMDSFKKDLSLFLKVSGLLLCVGSALELAEKFIWVYTGCYVIVILGAMVLAFRTRRYTKRIEE